MSACLQVVVTALLTSRLVKAHAHALTHCVHALSLTHTHTHTLSLTHTHTHTLSLTQTHTHTHKHTFAHSCNDSSKQQNYYNLQMYIFVYIYIKSHSSFKWHNIPQHQKGGNCYYAGGLGEGGVTLDKQQTTITTYGNDGHSLFVSHRHCS